MTRVRVTKAWCLAAALREEGYVIGAGASNEGAKMDTEPLLQFFSSDHLREDLRPIVVEFRLLAHFVVDNLPRNPERTVALRKLLEAKDCAVRAILWRAD